MTKKTREINVKIVLDNNTVLSELVENEYKSHRRYDDERISELMKSVNTLQKTVSTLSTKCNRLESQILASKK